jgi:glycerol uptake facilitator-like aquaporin
LRGSTLVRQTLSLPRRAAAEFTATLLLLAAVIGSGIMAERLAAGNAAVALLANTIATVFALFVLIEVFAPISGAHMNPLVTWWSGLPLRERVTYTFAQLAGAIAGAVLANAMFDHAVIEFAQKARGGFGQWLAEGVATAGLLLVVRLCNPQRAAPIVSAYIGAAYWFTSSTSFANPAAAFGRMFSDSFAGIAPASVTAFVLSQVAGAATGVALAALLAAPPQPAE